MNKHYDQIYLLRRQCGWQRAHGTSRDNGYPYHKHVPDCDICRSADLLEAYGNALERIASDEPLHTSPRGMVEFLPPLELAARKRFAQSTIEGEPE